ncbi:MAG: phosphate ABC transporter permease PstA [Planctomycetota bacterium]
MTTTTQVDPGSHAKRPAPKRPRARSSLFARGEPMVWITGGALILCLAMIVGLLAIVFINGFAAFWPVPIERVTTLHGKTLMGEVHDKDTYVPTRAQVAELVPQEKVETIFAAIQEEGGESTRRSLRTGNFELTQTNFHWVSDFEVAEDTQPEWATLLERLTWGRFYGFPKEFRIDGKVVASGPAETWEQFEKWHGELIDRYDEREDLKKGPLGDVDKAKRAAAKELRVVELDHGRFSEQYAAATKVFDAQVAALDKEREPISEKIAALQAENDRYVMVMRTADGVDQPIRVADIVRGYQANQQGFFGKLGIYFSRWHEFIWDDPREANSQGGVFPAIFGTVVMTLLMIIFVVPFGVLAALYLREYAKQGMLVSIVRIAVNNLAGVPSIVYGVFGLGFFCYIVGAGIDELFFAVDLADGNPTFGKGGLLWASLTLALLTLPVVIVATEEALAAVPRSMREGSYACGASKWQTIRRIVLPRALPGIMTGGILALARGAGEVAPLMLVGAAKIAPELPIDGEFPFLHPQRSFMHLGFHIYDVGFQSQDSVGTRPLVFTTTLLLILIVVALNIVAIWARARLRKRFYT